MSDDTATAIQRYQLAVEIILSQSWDRSEFTRQWIRMELSKAAVEYGRDFHFEVMKSK
jgi:hypothetical protein